MTDPRDRSARGPSRRRADDRGFTLIELLAVVVIIGVLSGIAIPQLLRQREKAATSAAIAALRGTMNVIPELLEQRGDFPDDDEVRLLASNMLGSFRFVGEDTPVNDSQTISIGTTDDDQWVVFATAASPGGCYYLAVHTDGLMDRHHDAETLSCTATSFVDAEIPLGW